MSKAKSQRWFIKYRVKTVNVVYVGETGRPLRAREHRKEVVVSQESSLEQKRPGQPVSATNLQSQIMFAMRIM